MDNAKRENIREDKNSHGIKTFTEFERIYSYHISLVRLPFVNLKRKSFTTSVRNVVIYSLGREAKYRASLSGGVVKVFRRRAI